MPEHKPFSGFEVVEQLPTGDQRKVYEVGIAETSDSLTRNEIVCWIQCQCGASADKNFIRGINPVEINAWVGEILETHKPECPMGIGI